MRVPLKLVSANKTYVILNKMLLTNTLFLCYQMKKKQLELQLQNVPLPPAPRPHIEQYMTPAGIAADILFTAYQFNDIQDKIVLDLGCGTGIFSIGAMLTGAKQVIGIDIDKESIALAQDYAKKTNLDIDYRVQSIDGVHTRCDTVIMNPPFGAQKSNQKADRRFIEKAFELANIVYSLHLKKTIPFIGKLVSSLGGDITYQKDYVFPIKWMFEFHTKKVKNYAVSLVRISTTNMS
jgi:putative methylase